MLISDINELDGAKISLRNSKYFSNGILLDTCVIFVYLLGKYVKLHPEKQGILGGLNVTDRQISCITTLINNFNISKIIITPHVLAEFLNRIRSEYKEGYKEIKRECLKDLRDFEEIYVKKDNLIEHKDFTELGNDISLVLATDEHIKKFTFGSIASFDGRFIQKSFKDSDNKVLAFDLGTIQYFF